LVRTGKKMGGDEYLKPKNRGMEGTTNMPLGKEAPL